MTPADEPDSRGQLRELHNRVDADSARLTTHHAARLECKRGCSACCCDDLTVFQVEADRIRAQFPEVLGTTPHAVGACAFLDDEGACRVYDARPYVCRTQGLPLLYFQENEREEIVEERSICELNLEGEPLDDIDMDDCWIIGPVELQLQQLQQSASGDQARVALRDLFKRS
ncbi:MAG: Fe-S-cluster containining protein [Planctomycetota bacterium]|jgi:Fe-S-cluster containining protein